MKIDTIFWDFDGVILSSHEIRELGFRVALEKYPQEQVDALMRYHRENGGWSRYVKFTYFFEEIRKESYTQEDVNQLAMAYSKAVKSLLIDQSLLIEESMRFIIEKGKKYRMYVASGSDGKELNEVCEGLGVANHFHSIHGSPEPKTAILKRIITEQKHQPSNCLMIGDARNDYDAAIDNNMHFLGFNNPEVEKLSTVNFTLITL